jgi:uncharacterized spore protein YtfJ
MEMNFGETFDKMLEQLRMMANTESVVGEPLQIGEFTCIPVIKMGVGFGGGGAAGGADELKKGKGKGNGGGAGAGIGITPIGFLVSRGREISFLSTSDKKTALETIFDKVPDLLDKVLEMKKGKEEEESKGKEKD